MNDLRRELAAVVTAHGGRFSDNHEPTLWLRARLAVILDNIHHGRMHACPHVGAHIVLGSFGVVVLWEPNKLACAGCLSALMAGGDADRTCDRCGTLSDTIHPDLAVAGNNLIVGFGLCPDCQRREAA